MTGFGGLRWVGRRVDGCHRRKRIHRTWGPGSAGTGADRWVATARLDRAPHGGGSRSISKRPPAVPRDRHRRARRPCVLLIVAVLLLARRTAGCDRRIAAITRGSDGEPRSRAGPTSTRSTPWPATWTSSGPGRRSSRRRSGRRSTGSASSGSTRSRTPAAPELRARDPRRAGQRHRREQPARPGRDTGLRQGDHARALGADLSDEEGEALRLALASGGGRRDGRLTRVRAVTHKLARARGSWRHGPQQTPSSRPIRSRRVRRPPA